MSERIENKFEEIIGNGNKRHQAADAPSRVIDWMGDKGLYVEQDRRHDNNLIEETEVVDMMKMLRPTTKEANKAGHEKEIAARGGRRRRKTWACNRRGRGLRDAEIAPPGLKA